MDSCSVGPGHIPTINCLFVLFNIGLTWAFGLAGVACLFLLITAGFKYITSGGGKQVEEAQKTLTYAIIGLLVVLLSAFIVNLIGDITGVTCFRNFSFTSCQ